MFFPIILQPYYAITINERHQNTSTLYYPWQHLTGNKVNGQKKKKNKKRKLDLIPYQNNNKQKLDPGKKGLGKYQIIGTSVIHKP